jgi:HK97 family phage major capsid protein
MRTIETISAEMRAITDGAEGRNLSDDEMSRFEALETELRNVNRENEIRSRQRAYQTPVALDTNVVIRDAQDADEQSRAFEHFLRTGQVNHDLIEARAQSIGTDSAGGFLVPDSFLTRIVERQKSYGGVASVASTIQTATGATIEFPSLDDTANSAAIATEGAAVASGGADLTFGTVSLSAYRYTTSGASNAPLKVSVELLQDASFDVQALLARVLGTRLARAEAPDFATGAGSTKPDGICIATLTADVKQTTSGTFTYAQLLDVEDALDEAYRQNARWIMNNDSWSKIRALTDSAGRPLVLENASSGIGGPAPKQLLGYPVIIDSAFPNAADDTPFAVFGDIAESYLIRRVGGVVVAVDPYSSIKAGQYEFTAWERVDGTVQNRHAYVALAGKDSA